eukprot:scaffold2746_cov394-Pavlova_lutheri.AAC.2
MDRALVEQHGASAAPSTCTWIEHWWSRMVPLQPHPPADGSSIGGAGWCHCSPIHLQMDRALVEQHGASAAPSTCRWIEHWCSSWWGTCSLLQMGRGKLGSWSSRQRWLLLDIKDHELGPRVQVVL